MTERRHAKRRERLAQLRREQSVVGEDDLVVVAPELGHVLRGLLEPGNDGLAVEAGRRELDDPEPFALELVEQPLEQRVRHDGNPASARIRHTSSASRRRSSSSGS